jgi:hypothetical protein
MSEKEKLKFYDLIKRCQDTTPDGSKLIKLASYDRTGERLMETGEPLHLDYILFGKEACFCISPEERAVLEKFLSE